MRGRERRIWPASGSKSVASSTSCEPTSPPRGGPKCRPRCAETPPYNASSSLLLRKLSAWSPSTTPPMRTANRHGIATEGVLLQPSDDLGRSSSRFLETQRQLRHPFTVDDPASSGPPPAQRSLL